MVGTATASNNFFRQIGGAVGAAVVGSLFSHRVATFMAERIPEALAKMGDAAKPFAERFAGGEAESITPHLVSTMPDELKNVILSSYNDALVPIFTMLAPAMVVAAVVLVFTRQEKLKETVS